MQMIILLVQQNIVMALYMIIGYLLYKKRIISKEGSADIGKMLLYVVMPMAIIKSYIRHFSVEMLRGFMISFMFSLAALAVAILISKICFKKKSVVKQFGSAFSNAGFIGIPLVQMVLGDEAVFYVASFVALLNILQWTYGVFIFTQDKTVISLKKIVTNPIVISLCIGLILFFLPVELPSVMIIVISTISAMNGPLAMIVLGTYLAQIRMSELFTDKETYLCAMVRLLLIPLATAAILHVLPESFISMKTALLFAAAAPVGANVAIFAQLYKQNYKEAVKDVCMSTILSIITMPLITLLINVV